MLGCSRLRGIYADYNHHELSRSYYDWADKRGGKLCIQRMQITVYDVLGWLAAGMSHAEILENFPELTEQDIRACLEFAAEREHRLVASVDAAWSYFSLKI